MQRKDTVTTKLHILIECLANELNLEQPEMDQLLTQELLIDGIPISFERSGVDLVVFSKVCDEANMLSFDSLKAISSSSWANPSSEVIAIDPNNNQLQIWSTLPIKEISETEFLNRIETFLNSAEYCKAVVQEDSATSTLQALAQV